MSDIPKRWDVGQIAYGEYRCRTSDREGSLAQRAYAEFETVRMAAMQINNAIQSGGYAK